MCAICVLHSSFSSFTACLALPQVFSSLPFTRWAAMPSTWSDKIRDLDKKPQEQPLGEGPKLPAAVSEFMRARQMTSMA
jgi:hypothetical protein